MELAAILPRERLARWLEPGSVRRRLSSHCRSTSAARRSTLRARRDSSGPSTPSSTTTLFWPTRGSTTSSTGHPPPAYTQNNDFAEHAGKYYVSFPPFPALILLPFAKLAELPENLRDGQIWLWLAGLGPSLLFLALEKLRRIDESKCSEIQNLALAWIFAFGTVYFFTAEQGTVWFSAHVVAVGAHRGRTCSSALEAERPFWAGLSVGLCSSRVHLRSWWGFSSCSRRGASFGAEASRPPIGARSPKN